MIAATSLLTACKKENENGLQGFLGETIMLTTESFHDYIDEKTSVRGFSVKWVNGDEVRLYGAEGYKDFPIEVNGKSQAYITNTLNLSGSIRGYYPISIINSCGASENANSPTVVIPSNYDCSAFNGSGHQIINLPLVAKATGGATTIEFKNLSAAVMVIVRNETGNTLIVDRVVVSSTTSKLSGTLSLNLNNDNFGIARQSGSGSVTVNLGNLAIANNSNDTVQVPILPVNSGENITIEIYTHSISNVTYTFCHSASVPNDLSRNKMLTARCKIHFGDGSHVIEATPLTFEAKTAGAIVTYSGSTLPVEYSTDGITWSSYSNPITLARIGDKVSFRGDNASYDTYDAGLFSCSKECYIYGNIMSLLNSTNFATTNTLTEENIGAFSFLFYGNSNIYNHPSKKILLPATTLSSSCYFGMFSGCSNLTVAPELPATTLVYNCYANMFQSCSNLTAAPSLPATTLAGTCYREMFRDCIRLTTPSFLPATTLVNGCYEGMFRGCTRLTYAPSLPATTLVNYCYREMFRSCASLNYVRCLATSIDAQDCTDNWLNGVAMYGTFKKAAGTNWSGKNSNNGIPSGWTVQEE